MTSVCGWATLGKIMSVLFSEMLFKSMVQIIATCFWQLLAGRPCNKQQAYEHARTVWIWTYRLVPVHTCVITMMLVERSLVDKIVCQGQGAENCIGMSHLHGVENILPKIQMGTTGHDSICNYEILMVLPVEDKIKAIQEAVDGTKTLNVHVHVDASIRIENEIPDSITFSRAKHHSREVLSASKAEISKSVDLESTGSQH